MTEPLELPSEEEVDRELARRSLAEFRRYVHADPETGESTLLESRWQEFAAAKLDAFLAALDRGERPKLVLQTPPQHGKLIADDEPVLTPDGWRRHGELTPGDRVYHPSGRSVRVVATSAPDLADVELEFSDGSTVRCHERHEWRLYCRTRKRWETLEAGDLLGTRLWWGSPGKRGSRRLYHLPKVEPLNGPERALPLEPYALGLWLGDGTSTKPWITHSPRDRVGVESLSYPVMRRYVHATTGVESSVLGEGFRDGLDAAEVLAKGYGQRTKRVPENYLTASLEQRLELLAGLVDSDGHVYARNGWVRLCTSDEELADTYEELIATFGWTSTRVPVKWAPRGRRIEATRLGWQIGFRPSLVIPCRLDRKKAAQRPARNPPRVALVGARRVASKRGRCIQVDAFDGLYLVGRSLIPTHNSLLVSDFLAYALGRYPRLRTALASYAVDLGKRANRHLRRVLTSERFRALFPESGLAEEPRTATHLELENGKGSFRNTTIRGAITGQPVDLGVIDDPVKSRKEAESLLERDRVWDWFTNEFLSRLHERSGYLLILTRWHLDDLAGRILANVSGVEVLSFPAYAEVGDPLGREVGDPLFPELQSKSLLEEKRTTTPESDWLALYQQRPTPREGAIVKTAWFKHRYVVRGERPERITQSWDTASKANEWNAPSVCLTVAEFPDRDELWDVYCERVEYPELRRDAEAQAAKWGPGVVLVEDKSSGQQLLQQLRKETTLPVIAVEPDADKETRLRTETPFLEAGNLWLPDPSLGVEWLEAFLAEVTTFPASPLKDQVDALSQYLRWRREHRPRVVPGPRGTTKPSGRIASAADTPRASTPRTPKLPAGVGRRTGRVPLKGPGR